MKIHTFRQGDAAWHQHRASARNASDAAAVLGCHKYMTRAELMHQRHTGVRPEVDAAQQRRFDEGHSIEAAQRPGAAALIGEDLFPVVGSAIVEGIELSASFDGLTMLEDVAFECKTLNDGLRAVLPHESDAANEGNARMLPKHYRVQMEQQLMVCGGERILFVAASKDGTDVRRCWYYPDQQLRAEILAGWRQFDADLAAYVPAAPISAAAPRAEPLESLPAVLVEARGELSIHSNLDAFGQALKAFVARIPKQPTTDDEFATCDAACKALKRAEETLAAEEARALAGLADVEKMRRLVADLQKIARDTRLASEKLVTRRKLEIKEAEVARGRNELTAHCERLNNALAAPYMPVIAHDFAGCISGLKKLDSLRAAIDQHLADKKIEAGEIATRIAKNLKWFADNTSGQATLFADLRTLVLQDETAFQAVCSQRCAQHQQEQAAKLEAERARIRAEEAARLEREQQQRERDAARQAAEAARYQPPAAAPVAPIAPSAPVVAPAPVVVAMRPTEPGATLRLGQINERIAPLQIDASGLARLGFQPVAVDKAAKLYPLADLPRILAACIAHLQALANPQQAA